MLGGKKRGRPAHEPTKQIWRPVLKMRMPSIALEAIALVEGISVPTLPKHYREKLETGLAIGDVKVAAAASDDGVNKRNDTLLRLLAHSWLNLRDFILKARLYQNRDLSTLEDKFHSRRLFLSHCES